MDKIEEYVKNRFDLEDNDKQQIKDEIDKRLESLRKRSPFKINIVREEYPIDKETLIIESVIDCNGDDLTTNNFSLQIQSMNESEGYWLDTGIFSNLSIK